MIKMMNEIMVIVLEKYYNGGRKVEQSARTRVEFWAFDGT